MSGAVILGASCCFPSGPSIELADTALRMQLSLVQYQPGYVDAAGVPVRVSCFPDGRAFDAARWAWLARQALAQLTHALAPAWAELQHAPRLLWLVLPGAERPGMPAELVDPVGAAVQHALWPWERIEVVRGGHAAGLLALDAARQALAVSPQSLAVVLAVECGLGAEALLWLDMQGLLHGAHAARPGGHCTQPHGCVPGEGAAAIALSAQAPLGWARLLGCATAAEAHTRASGRPCVGAALSQAAAAALRQAAQHSGGPVGQVSVDLNGEPYRADEFGFTALRLSPALRAGWKRLVPALASGDLHSASAVAHVALAAYALRERPQAGPHLVLAASDDALRGAAVLGPIRSVSSLPEVCPWRSPSTSTA